MSLLAEEQEISLTEDEKKLAGDAASEYYKSLNDEEKSFMGLSQTDIKQIYEKYALANKLYNSMTAGVDSEVSDDEARVMNIQQIIVSDEEQANQIEAALQSGDEFASLAGTYNEAGSVEADIARDTYPEEVENVAFELENNEISGKIPASDGKFYFIKCVNKFDEELTEKNKEHILEKREKEKFFDAYNDFVGNAEFELNTELWDSISLEDEKNITTDSFFKVYDKYFTGGN